MLRPVDDATIDLLRGSLGRSATRASVVTSNLVNLDTPGYQALRADFPATLGRAQAELEIERTHPSHLGPSPDADPPVLTRAPVTRLRADGNSVDVDVEMTALAALQGQYNAAARLVQRRFALLRYTVSDGRS
jgi:flagellar basal-body rod protein FlgB